MLAIFLIRGCIVALMANGSTWLKVQVSKQALSLFRSWCGKTPLAKRDDSLADVKHFELYVLS